MMVAHVAIRLYATNRGDGSGTVRFLNLVAGRSCQFTPPHAVANAGGSCRVRQDRPRAPGVSPDARMVMRSRSTDGGPDPLYDVLDAEVARNQLDGAHRDRRRLDHPGMVADVPRWSRLPTASPKIRVGEQQLRGRFVLHRLEQGDPVADQRLNETGHGDEDSVLPDRLQESGAEVPGRPGEWCPVVGEIGSAVARPWYGRHRREPTGCASQPHSAAETCVSRGRSNIRVIWSMSVAGLPRSRSPSPGGKGSDACRSDMLSGSVTAMRSATGRIVG